MPLTKMSVSIFAILFIYSQAVDGDYSRTDSALKDYHVKAQPDSATPKTKGEKKAVPQPARPNQTGPTGFFSQAILLLQTKVSSSSSSLLPAVVGNTAIVRASSGTEENILFFSENKVSFIRLPELSPGKIVYVTVPLDKEKRTFGLRCSLSKLNQVTVLAYELNEEELKSDIWFKKDAEVFALVKESSGVVPVSKQISKENALRLLLDVPVSTSLAEAK